MNTIWILLRREEIYWITGTDTSHPRVTSLLVILGFTCSLRMTKRGNYFESTIRRVFHFSRVPRVRLACGSRRYFHPLWGGVLLPQESYCIHAYSSMHSRIRRIRSRAYRQYAPRREYEVGVTRDLQEGEWRYRHFHNCARQRYRKILKNYDFLC